MEGKGERSKRLRKSGKDYGKKGREKIGRFYGVRRTGKTLHRR